MFILTKQEKQKSRLILELGTEVTVKHLMKFAHIVFPVRPIPKKPNQFMVDWILKKKALEVYSRNTLQMMTNTAINS